jgi:Membrane carboxypeptidase (penicillin-binding protein)
MDITSKVERVDYEFDDFDYLVMALEDRRYLRHRGVDIKSVLREFIKMVTLNKHGGASTIDMQMVRTITNYKELTLKRKVYEMILSLLINFRFSKNEIMKCYMDNAFFGSHLIGVEKASMAEYGKGLSEISYEEKARLAAMLLTPRPKNPTERWRSVVKTRAAYAKSMRGRVKNGS